MASRWVKPLQCKSRAFDDVYHPNPKVPLLPSPSCRRTVQNLKDVIETTKSKSKPKPKKPKPLPPPPPPPPPCSKNPRPTKPEPGSNPNAPPLLSSSARHGRSKDSFFPALTELPEGHPSRNVVEIIFHTSWSPKAFAGRIEMIFKVQNGSKTVTRFEEYREVVKSRAGSGVQTGGSNCEENARCVADGNEVMRFHCLGPTPCGGGAYDACGVSWVFPGGKEAAICTYSGSGPAHESAGWGRGRRAMLVCRVIAGRVSNQLGISSLLEGGVGFESVSGNSGELFVFDSRAVLPCFLIIYKL